MILWQGDWRASDAPEREEHFLRELRAETGDENPTHPLHGKAFRVLGWRELGHRHLILHVSPDDRSWPSILSVAHDVADGAQVFVIADRPVVRVGPAAGFPLSMLSAGGGRLWVVSATAVLPYKWRLRLSGAVPAGAAWAWGASGGGGDLVDPVTHVPLNAAAGEVADVPGPYAPPAAAAVVVASQTAVACSILFDRPLNLVAGAGSDDAVTFDGLAPDAVAQSGPYTLDFTPAAPLTGASTWAIARQPEWVDSPVAWPAAGGV